MKTLRLLFAMMAAIPLSVFSQSRVIGGTDATIYERPFQVFIQEGGLLGGQCHLGGGVLIDNKWVLTAAHVVDSLNTQPWQYCVKYGSSNLNYCDYVNVDSVILHPNYRIQENHDTENDIALLRLSLPISNSATHSAIPVSSSTGYYTGDTAVVSGWGRTEWEGGISYTLKKADVIISRCAGPNIYGRPSSTMPYHGDSGGPLTYDGKLIGIVRSVAKNNPTANESNYTNVGYYYNWLNNWAVLSVSLNTPSFLPYGSTSIINWYPSAPFDSYTVSSNLTVVSTTDRSITVRGSDVGYGNITVVVNGRPYSASINVGVPVIYGVSYDYGYLFASMYNGATVNRTEWVIEGNNYSAYDSFLWCPYSNGTINVRVRAESNGVWSNWYETQVNLDNNFNHYSFSVTNNAISIHPKEELQVACIINDEEAISYNIINAITQETTMCGQLGEKGGIINIANLKKGNYIIIIRNKTYSKSFKFSI